MFVVVMDGVFVSMKLVVMIVEVFIVQEIFFDFVVWCGMFDNGLQFYVCCNVKLENCVELCFVVNVGLIFEDDDQQGLVYFVEYMVFNGMESFEKQEFVEYLECIGMCFGVDINVYMSFDEMVYMLQILIDDEQIVLQVFQIFEEWVYKIDFEGEEIDKECGVVIEEWCLCCGVGGCIQDKQIFVFFYDLFYVE